MNYSEYKKQNGGKVVTIINEIIEVDNLSAKKRTRSLVNKRNYLMWFLREYTNLTFTEIGKMFNRHHASIIHSIQKHEDFMEWRDKEYLKDIKLIESFLTDQLN